MDFERARKIMVETQLQARDITDKRVLDVFYRLPRHRFVPDGLIEEAYGDYPLPIGDGQTISQPYMVALMSELLNLKGEERVLEVGTGSGYQAAILAEMACKVYTVERISSIANTAMQRLKEQGYTNIYFKVGDGILGWKEFAPFDRIIVTAAASKIPPELLKQLGEGGKMVMPIGGNFSQMLTLVEKDMHNKITTTDIMPCVFVPLVGS